MQSTLQIVCLYLIKLIKIYYLFIKKNFIIKIYKIIKILIKLWTIYIK